MTDLWFFFGQHFILLHTLKTEWNPSFRFNPICKKDSHKKVYFMVVYQEYLNMRLHENMDLGVGLGPSSTVSVPVCFSNAISLRVLMHKVWIVHPSKSVPATRVLLLLESLHTGQLSRHFFFWQATILRLTQITPWGWIFGPRFFII